LFGSAELTVRLRKLHFAVGLAGVVVFLATGAYMRAGFPDLYAANEVLRYLYRSNHVYVLLASLINVALGVHLAPVAPGWRATVSTIGSLLALVAPVVLCLAFFLEAPKPSPERVLTLLGVVALAAGIALHVLGGARHYDES
jgi:FtsH-binding integral membrane protein